MFSGYWSKACDLKIYFIWREWLLLSVLILQWQLWFTLIIAIKNWSQIMKVGETSHTTHSTSIHTFTNIPNINRENIITTLQHIKIMCSTYNTLNWHIVESKINVYYVQDLPHKWHDFASYSWEETPQICRISDYEINLRYWVQNLDAIQYWI